MQDDAEAFRARGMSVTGPHAEVDRFAAGLTVLSEKQLGSTKSVVVYGAPGQEQRSRAVEAGLEVGPLPLQDLFVHLIASGGAER